MPRSPAIIHYADDSVTLHHGDALAVLRELPDASVDAVVTDPPYGLEFMGREWDAPWQERGVNADAGFNGGGVSATRNAPSFTGSTNPKCLTCRGTRRGRRDGTAKVAVCLCEDGGRFPNVRAVEMRAFGEWCEAWATECLRVLKPGGHLLAFGGTRTWHRLVVAVEDAGFEVRDSIAWLYGSGFPKSLNVSKAIDKTAGEKPIDLGPSPHWRESKRDREKNGGLEVRGANAGRLTAPATPEAEHWRGWGTALKPAFEPICVARKSLAGTVATNVLTHGTGALNVDGCRVSTTDSLGGGSSTRGQLMKDGWHRPWMDDPAAVAANAARSRESVARSEALGRWPANVVLDEHAAADLDQQSGVTQSSTGEPRRAHSGDGWRMTATGTEYDDLGGASRFFYTAKAGADERVRLNGVAHPTVKPLSLMRWLVRLVTPPGGVVLEPFAGSGTTVEACILEGFRCVAIERETDYLPLIVQRINRRRDPVAAVRATGDDCGLFDLIDPSARAKVS